MEYISDTIKETDIDSWKNGERILVSSQTGSGKSFFVKENLYNYCKNRNKKILLLSNRNLLRKQNSIDLYGKEDIVQIKNYQSMESHYLDGESLEELFETFDFIIFDECHYFFSDSSFNHNTDILIEPIIDTPKDKIFIFLTATPEALLNYQSEFSHPYTLERDYSYIKDIYFFNKKSTIDLILERIPPNEKVIYFASDALDAYSISEKNQPNARFICSESHGELARKSNKQVYEEIAEKQQFTCQILATTKVADNGINLVDPSVLHIILDMLDPISFIQCLGRKRIVGNEKITIYARNYYYGLLFPIFNQLNTKLNLVYELEKIGRDAFLTKYKKKDDLDNVIQRDGTINIAKRIFLETFRSQISGMVLDPSGYKKYICDYLDFPLEETKNAEECYEREKLDGEITKLVNIRLYKEDQENLKRLIFTCLYSPKNHNYRKLGMGSFNSIMEDNKLPFHITSNKDGSKEHRGQHYWFITRTDI